MNEINQSLKTLVVEKTNLLKIDGPAAEKVKDDIEGHFGRPIVKLDTENVDETEKLQG